MPALALVLVVLAPYLAYLGVILFDVVFRPTRRRLAVRNMIRRRNEALLVVLGAMLGTAIITGSLVVGDSVSGSIVDGARVNLGPIDESVRTTDAGRVAELDRLLTDPPLPGTDGTLAAQTAGAAAATIGPDRRAVDTTLLVEVDFDRARRFGDNPRDTGLAAAGATPGGDEAVVNQRLAGKLAVRAGDRIELFAYGTTHTVTVRDIVPELGLAGLGGFQNGAVVTPVFVSPGTISRLATGGAASSGPSTAAPSTTAPSNAAPSNAAPSTAPAPAGTGRAANPFVPQPPSGVVFVSNTGDVFEGPTRTAGVEAAIKARLGDAAGIEVNLTKQALLDQAERQGTQLTQTFSSIGYFSVAAGLLLLVNLFVMLAEERKTELGLLRALGFRRNHIMRTFSVEGALYSLAAAVLGGLAGIGVGWGITRLATGIFNAGNTDERPYRLVAEPLSVLSGMGIGFTISMATVFVTSLLISRFNIILAIRNLPKPVVDKAHTRSSVAGLLGMAAGLAVTAASVSSKNSIGVIAGPAVICFSAMPVLSRVLPRRVVTPALALVVVLWSSVSYSVIPDVMGQPSINTFVIEGLILVAAAIVLFTSFDRLWLRALALATPRGSVVAGRLGLAYPLARRFRTGLLLGMFTLVIFTMTFLSAFSEIFASQAPQITSEINSGFDILVDANPTNPVPLDAIRAQPGVQDAVALVRTRPRFTTKHQVTPRLGSMTGFSEDFLRYQTPVLRERSAAYPDDLAAFRAVIADPTLAILPASFLQGGAPGGDLRAGDKVTVNNPANPDIRELTIAGVIDREFLGNGALVGADFARSFMRPLAVESRTYVKVAPGADATNVATSLQGAFVPNGAHADTFRAMVTQNLGATGSFISLMRGYLGMGLLIGVAGLGVVMVRAVRERRRQIGMLRAMGFPARVVRRAFLIESSFVALQGIVLGVLLGMLTSYQLLANSSAFGDSRLPYQVPLFAIVFIVLVPLTASLVATSFPAGQASRIKPAAALRIAD